MLDVASRTPLLGGGGVETFMNTALAAPISGVTPPYLLGAMLSVPTRRATVSLFVHDPRNAQDSDVLEQPFDDGVTFSLSASVPVELCGLRGFQNLRGVYSTQKGIDLRDVPQLQLPPELRDEPRDRDPYWCFSYSFQQFLQHDPTDPTKSWGLFFQWGLSDGNPNPIKWHVFGGLGGNSPIPGRSEDRWGVAYFNYRVSNSLREAARRDLGVGIKYESGVEIFYNLAVTPWFRLTPDPQFIDPLSSDKDDAILAGLRAQLKF